MGFEQLEQVKQAYAVQAAKHYPVQLNYGVRKGERNQADEAFRV
jgi:hypothetical protein